MAGKRFSKWTAVSMGGVVAASPLIAACGSAAAYDNWAATDGAAGRINLDDVPAEYQIAKTPEWLRDRWRREPGAPRPHRICQGTYNVKRAEMESWLESLKEEDQRTILRRDAIVSRQAGRKGRLTLDVPHRAEP